MQVSLEKWREQLHHFGGPRAIRRIFECPQLNHQQHETTHSIPCLIVLYTNCYHEVMISAVKVQFIWNDKKSKCVMDGVVETR